MQLIDVKGALNLLATENQLSLMKVKVNSRALSSQEAIGDPERRDFPLLRGKEVLIQAEVEGGIGQAFTSDPISFSGTVSELLNWKVERFGKQALEVAVLNALCNKLGLANNTIHCLNNEPEECAKKISSFLLEQHGLCNVGIVGYQPAILEHCAQVFGTQRVRITDLNPDNIGQVRYGVQVWDGFSDTHKLIDESDVLLVTGTILVNGTHEELLSQIGDKPYYFYGTTCAGLAAINKMNRLCPMSR